MRSVDARLDGVRSILLAELVVGGHRTQMLNDGIDLETEENEDWVARDLTVLLESDLRRSDRPKARRTHVKDMRNVTNVSRDRRRRGSDDVRQLGALLLVDGRVQPEQRLESDGQLEPDDPVCVSSSVQADRCAFPPRA